MEELLEDIVDQEGRALLRLAWALTGSADQARDLVQDCLVKVAVQWRKVARADHRSADVRSILINLWRDQSRRHVLRSVPIHDEPAALSPDADRVLDRHVLLQAMGALSPQQRQIVALRFFDDQKVDATARVMGCSNASVRTQTHRALHTLRRHPQLQRYVPDLEGRT